MFGFFKLDLVKIKEAKEKILKDLSNDTAVWDPLGKGPDLNIISRENARNQLIYNELKKNPGYVKKKFYQILLFSLLLGGGVIALTIIFAIDARLIFLGIFIAFSLPSAYHIKWKKIGKDLIKLQIAQSKGWIYNPSKNSMLWIEYAGIFREIFSKGDESQNFEDIFWGSVKKGLKTHQFVAGNFEYYIVSRDSKGRKHRSKHEENFFIIHLPKDIKTRFFIYPENIFSKIGNFFTKKEVNTESNKFNKTFAFKYNGSKDEKAMEIVKILSPRVQEELIKLNESDKTRGLNVLFSKNSVVFLFKGPMINKMKTDFIFKSTELHQDDVKFIEDRLDTLTDISTEIVKYLD